MHTNQKYPSVLKNYGRNQFIDIFYIKTAHEKPHEYNLNEGFEIINFFLPWVIDGYDLH